MQLQFVDHAKIDAQTRKQIRSQVMLGKNAGKKRQRTKNEAKKLAVLRAKSSESSKTSLEDSCATMAVLNHWDEFSTFSYPRQLEPYTRRILRAFLMSKADLLYPKELCFEVSDCHKIFFELFQSNEAFFHCLLAMAEGEWCVQLGRTDLSNLMLHYLANTYRCINNDLKRYHTPSLGIVTAVMSLSMHENLFGMTMKSKLHLDALERMVEIRGGLKSIEHYTAILHKVCRNDIEYALQVGTRPRFQRDAFPREEVSGALEVSVQQQMSPVFLHDDVIRHVFEDSLNVSRILNNVDGTNPRLKPFSFQDILISLANRLLHAYPLCSPRPTNVADDACHLALLALVTTMFIQGSSHHQQYYHLIADRLRNGITELCADHTRFKFWVCFVACISVLNSNEDKMWLVPIIKSLATALQVRKWDEAKGILTTFPWVRYFHDEPGQDFWNKSIDI